MSASKVGRLALAEAGYVHLAGRETVVARILLGVNPAPAAV